MISGGNESGAIGDPMTIGVLMATRNRPDDLARALPSLAAQDHPSYRVYVFDQSDDPEPGRRLVAALHDDRFVHTAQHGVGKSRALNAALAASCEPIVAFTDDDCVPPTGWLSSVADVARTTDADVWFGQVVAASPYEPTIDFIPECCFEQRDVIHGPWMRSRPGFGIGANMAARRSVLEAIGGFDERLGPGSVLRAAEDVDVVHRAQRSGFVIARDPATPVVHYGHRAVDGGAASMHISDAYFGIGAVYGLHMRSLDWRAGTAAIDEARMLLQIIVAAAVRRRPPYHLRRVASYLRGLVAGLRTAPVTRSTASSDRPDDEAQPRLRRAANEPCRRSVGAAEPATRRPSQAPS